ncbi:hypothetical protein A20C1_08308 [marine actinobacterium PHSC20C1]|nr:hypothetical protein A20C1_08308 [marine actinobacterium PHSC20C1]
MHDWADQQRKGKSSPAQVAAKNRADRENNELDAAAHDPDLAAEAMVDARHEAVAWSRPESCTQVESGSDSEERQAGNENQDSQEQSLDLGKYPESELGERANERNVEHSADTGLLADRNPQQQHDQSNNVGDKAKGNSRG